MIDTFGTGKVDEDAVSRAVDKLFDLRPAAIIHRFDLRRPIYCQTAAYGHMGREDIDLPWEKTDMVDALKAELGL
jgi:S-adenosylmethionine synthetase